MPIVPDDPRLTAYALGELEEAGRPEMESLLAVDADARAVVEEVRATARLLSTELQAESSPGLAPQHRQAIAIRLEPAPRKVTPRASSPRRRWAGVAVAASLLGLSVTLVLSAIREARRERQLATLALNKWSPGLPGAREAERGIKRPSSKPNRPQATSVAGSESLRSDVTRSSTVSDNFGFESERGEGIDRPVPSARSLKPDNRGAGELSAADKFDLAGGLVEQRQEPGLKGGGKSGLGYQPGTPVAETSTLLKGKGEKAPASKFARNSVIESLGRVDSNAARPPHSEAGVHGGNSAVDGEAKESLDKLKSAKTFQLALADVDQPAAPAGGVPDRRLFQKQAAVDQLRGPAASRTTALDVADRGEALPEAESKITKMAEVDLKQGLPIHSPARTLGELAGDRRKRLEDEKVGGEAFQPIVNNPFLSVLENPLSTFSIDVDTASYANVRRYLNQNSLPPRDAVRIEELINYFPYRYPAPRAGEPFSVNCEVARCPWDAGHRLVRIGLKGREIDVEKRPPSNLVFLVDVSGSMEDLDKLPLLKAGMKLLVEQLGENDRVAIVVYAGQEGLALESTRCDHKAAILSTLEQLQAGGSTNGGKGIQLAYDVAVRNFIKGGTNRVLLATDGDFNVGVTEGPDLDRLIEEKRQSGVFLSVLGFGQGNVKHDKLESLADKGNGNYSFIDSIKEARKVLVEQMGGTLVAIAKDVKVQVVFNPDRASAFRLIGYENRMLQDRDFEDDRKDAGEVGAGHCVTVLYEVVPAGQGALALSNNQASKLAQQAAKGNSRLMEVRLRFKAPDGDVSRLISSPIDDDGHDFAAASADLRFASSVAGFGMLLRDSPHQGSLTWGGLLELASGAIGDDSGGYRAEFLDLVRKAQAISTR